MAYFAASIDDTETNKKFAESLELDFPILSDPEKTVAEAYGVLGKGGAYAQRHTFYIGVDGKILEIDRKVNPATAGSDVAEKLEQLGVGKRESEDQDPQK